MASSLLIQREQPDGAQTIVRAFQVLEAFANGEKELGVRELSRRLSLPGSTVHRLVSSLQSVGALEQNMDTGRYRLGLKLFELGSLVAVQRGFTERVQRNLETLVSKTGETAHLAVLDAEGYAVLVNRLSGPRAVTVGGMIGARRPVYCSAVGKSLIAFLDETEQKRIIASHTPVAYTLHTIVTSESLEHELTKVRALGYSVDDEEFEEGLRCLAAPIFNRSGRVIAAIGISGPSQRINHDTLPRLAQMVKDEAELITQDLKHSLFVTDDLASR